MPSKRRASAKHRSAKRKKSNTSITLCIEFHNGVFINRVICEDENWHSTPSLECVTHGGRKYHVGDMVNVKVAHGRSEVRQELAVVAEFREPDVSLVWVFGTNNTEERKKIVGEVIASAHNFILSTCADVAPISSIMSHHERVSMCMDHILDLAAAEAIPITEPRDGCFMRRLVEKIKARELIEGSATPSEPLGSARPHQDINTPSVPEQENIREPANLRDQPSLSPAPVEHSEASASGSSTYAYTIYQHQHRETPTASGSSTIEPSVLHIASSSEEGGNVNRDVLADDSHPNAPPSPSFSPLASDGSHHGQIIGSTQPHGYDASESPLTPRAANLHGALLPVRTADGNTESENQQQHSNPLKQRYNQTAEPVVSGLRELRQNAKAEVEQLPQHLKDGLITFLESFGPSVPVFDPEYLWDSSRAQKLSMPEDKHLLVTTLPIFQQLSLHENHGMPKYVLVKSLEPNHAMEANWEGYLSGFLCEHPETEFEIQDVTDDEGLTFQRKASEIHRRLSNKALRKEIPRKGEKSQDMIPWNLLDIHGGYLRTGGLRAIQGIPRFRCLATLCEQIEQPDLLSAGKHQGPIGSSVFSGCLDFALVGERGSYSKAHVDLLGSTGIEILFGRKAWFLLDGDMTDEEKRQFAREGQDWQPSPERVKMVPLGPGDTLLMMPGHLSPHLVVTVETCLSSGGMFWDEFKLSRTLENLRWTFEHPGATNEHVDSDITKLIDTIQERRGPAANEAQKLKNWMRERFRCKCKKDCGVKCRCSKRTCLKTVGCTSWCQCGCE